MFKFFLPSFILVALLTQSAFSQGDQGFTITPDPDHPEVFIAGPPEQIPIIREDMPWDVVLAYMVLDTICKTYTSQEIAARLETLSDDSLLVAWHLMYRAFDYDPFLVQLLAQYTQYHDRSVYKTDYGTALFGLHREYGARFKGIPRDDLLTSPNSNNPYKLIQLSCGIYHVRCLGLESRPATFDQYLFGPDCPDSVYWADGLVLQVYSGAHYYSNCNTEDYELTGGCIRYTWHARSCDSARWAWRSMIPGKEYLVFSLVDYGEGDDIENEQYSKWQMMTWKRFEISNGYILDPNKYFKQGDTLPLENVEAFIDSTMNELTGR